MSYRAARLIVASGLALWARPEWRPRPSSRRCFPASRTKANCSGTRGAPSPAPPRAGRAGWNWPTGARSSSTRSATSPGRCSPSCCGFCRSASSNGLAAPEPSASTCGSSPTNRDLERLVEDGSFRSDLYYRLNVFPITIPPLRDRIEDVAPLARHFAAQCARRTGRPVPAISDAAMDALRSWSWPGNIRELQNVIERAVIVTSGPDLVLPVRDLQSRTRLLTAVPKPAATFKDADREAILRALRDSGGLIAGPSGAAALLGLRRTTLQSKMRKLAIRRPSF